jgi:hypothetical protein
MPKQSMTCKDIKAMNQALDEKKAAEAAMQQSFIEQKPKAELDAAISQWMEKDRIWNEMGEKFFEWWPKPAAR